ncbi:DUF342 domain-containing protein [Clostridium punense]|nr:MULTISPECIES: flagellar assembly protein A [Clostridium]
MEYNFQGRNLEDCLEQASNALSIPKGELIYKVISDKKGIFKKKICIIVNVESQEDGDTYYSSEEISGKTHGEVQEGKYTDVLEGGTGTAVIKEGKLIINDPAISGEEVTISKGKGVSLKVDGKDVVGKVSVTSKSQIDIEFESNEAKREMNISISEDKMECYISIKYTPEIIYGLQDVKESRSVVLNSVVIEEKYPALYTDKDIMTALKSKGINYGYCLDNIKKCSNSKDVNNVLVAQAKPSIPAEDDIVEICFKQHATNEFDLDDSGNVDFKSIGNIASIKKGDCLCKRIVGHDGVSGMNVFGQVIPGKKRKVKDIIAKEGCELVDSNIIVATMDGKPQVKGNIFSVHNVHKIMSDVDIKTGNIHFIGDVIIFGDVKEGMSVESGNSLFINSNVFRAILKAGSDVNIKGNVISSSIVAGSGFVEVLKYNESLKVLANTLHEFNKVIEQVKNSKFATQNISDAALMKNIIDSKFRTFKSDVNNTLKYMYILKDTQNKVFRMISEKLSDAYFSKINDYKEIKYIEELISEKIVTMSGYGEVLSNITLNYVQDSNVECSGDIIITGKGVYKSYITAMNELIFTGNENSTAKGGVLRAKGKIEAKTVGAPTGVGTVLAVSKEGHIYCSVAHLNTKIIIGEKETILDESYRQVHAYLNKDSELVVDKFKL